MTYKYVGMQMWRRNNHIEVDGLGRVNVRLRIKLEPVAILIKPRPKLASIHCEHDVPYSLSLNNILLNQRIYQLPHKSSSLFMVLFQSLHSSDKFLKIIKIIVLK